MAKKPNPIVAAINSGIANLKMSKRDIAEDIRQMQASRKKFHHVLNHIVTPEPSGGSIQVVRNAVFVSYRNLASFKDLRLETTLEGLSFIGEPTRTRDWAEYINRDYHFDVPFADGTKINVVVSAFVGADSPTCRKVKVGEEYKVVDKFELVCD